MMREARSALRSLLVLQKERRKRDADSAACTSAAWTEHCALRLMQAALSPEPTPAPAPLAEPPAHPAPPAAPEPQPAPAAAEPVVIEEDAEFDPIAEAEHYAAIYPERAALIRRAGRVPDTVTFGPPDDEIVQTLITARTPALAALDREYAQAHAA